MPAFPLAIDYNWVSSKDKDNVIAALEYPDRVRRITLSGVTEALWKKLDTKMQEPFPALARLSLSGPNGKDEPAPMLPCKLLGGGTPRLQELYLRGMSYPGLPQFLLSARDLVKLDFTQIPPTCCVTPQEMLTGLAGLTRLESLAITFLRPSIDINLLTDQRLTAPSPATPAVNLYALDTFKFKGYCEYLEDLMARIDAPHVTTFNIEYFSQPAYHLPQLARFLVRSEYLKSPEISCVEVRFIPWTDISFSGSTPSRVINLTCKFNTSGMIRGVLHSVELFQQISATLTNIVSLTLLGPASTTPELPFGPFSEFLFGESRFARSFGQTLGGKPLLDFPGVKDSTDDIDWIALFRPFTGVKTLRLRGELSDNVIRALELVGGNIMTAKLLPALHAVRFVKERPTVSVDRFVSKRQNAGRPVTISYPGDDDDDE